VHVASGKVARVVGDFEANDVISDQSGKVVRINRGSYFIPYEFLPSMDGGFWGTGLGVLLGDISETINSIINMMMDAGHMASLGGGFIGSEFRIKGGASVFKPGEWKLAAAKGGDIRSSIVPMTFPGPDATLFQMLGLLIEAGKEVASVKDIMTGDNSKNMTATTTLALIEQGMMVFTAAYKRIFRSLRHEFKLLAKINSTTVSPEEYNQFHDAVDQQGQPMQFDPAQEYGAADMDIMPMADPSAVTKMQMAAKAQIVMGLAESGMVDPQEAVKRILEAASINDAEALMPQPPEPDPMQQMMMQMSMEAAKADMTLKMVSIQQAMADIEETRSKTIKNTTDAAATAQAMKLDQMTLMLEAARDGLAQLIGGRFGSMASGPGGGMPSVGNLAGPQGPAGNGPVGVLGRPTLVRGGQAGFNPGAGAF
jgi:chaperonin GroES